MKLELRIRELRQQKKMTLADLAGKIGVSVPHLSGVERGVKRINNHLLERLSEALDVRPEDLIGIPGDRVGVLYDLIGKLEPEDQKLVEAYAQGLLASQKSSSKK